MGGFDLGLQEDVGPGSGALMKRFVFNGMRVKHETSPLDGLSYIPFVVNRLDLNS